MRHARLAEIVHLKNNRMENTHANKNPIAIHSIPPLTGAMLSANVADGKSLRSFIDSQCSVVPKRHPIYCTENTSLFKRLKENRQVNEAHVQALMSSFDKDGYLFTIVYVNERLEIIDGQHRCEAAKRLQLPVYFMIMPGWGMREVTILNVNSRNWTINDFMETHAKAGNPNYVRFKEFFDAHEFDVTTCQLIVTGRRSGGYAASDEFRLGQMQVDDQQLTDGYLKAKKIADMQPFHPLGWKSRNFVEAMLTLLAVANYDHDHLLLKLQTYPDILLAGAKSLRTDEYLKIFLDKYNFRRLKDRLDISRR